MKLTTLRTANQKRHTEWANGGEELLSFRGVELTGEAYNKLRQPERVRPGRVGGKEDIDGLQEELADVLICVDLNMMDLGIDCRSGEDVRRIRTGPRNLTSIFTI